MEENYIPSSPIQYPFVNLSLAITKSLFHRASTIFKKDFFYVYLFMLRERESERAGRDKERDRKRGRISSRLHTVSTEPRCGA